MAQTPNAEICAALAKTEIPAGSIGLPTTGASILTAAMVAANEPNNPNGDYCKVTGAIRPVDPKAPNILFQVNLPAKWNGKAVHMGGGGFNGTVVTGQGAVSMGLAGVPPLSQGYATFGSDSGHQDPTGGPSFAANDEALLNYGALHLKKTLDVATDIIARHYGKRPARMYFAGASTGGREGLTVAQRWPEYYDGVVATAPAFNFTGVRMNGLRIGRAFYAPGGALNLNKQKLVHARVLDTCDPLDGVRDGIVSAVQACDAKAESNLAALRCPGGKDTADNCLSDAQINTVRTIRSDMKLPYQLADGVTVHQGYNVLAGADFYSSLGLGTSATLAVPADRVLNGYLPQTGDGWAKYFLARDEKFDGMTLDPAKPGAYQARIVELSGQVGSTNPNLDHFRVRGSKLILMHGLSDNVISPNTTVNYYKQLVARYGQARADGFVRFYTAPGFAHGAGTFNLSWDALGALDAWVDGGKAPETLVGTDTNAATRGRTRPLCRYPAWPKYVGGDNKLSGSFACVTG
jgi:feruloyl esterase